MASIIRVLDEQTINQIAAGEVIENPSSVVKELVENSIDAGATEIHVEIQGGGRQLIRVTDNGSGMSRDDALLSLERHATSKIRGIHDIHSITSMGFRGEAIPSIASISKFTLTTRLKGSEEGTLIQVEGGKVLNCSSVASSEGTVIEVKSLFYNVPVRKKFQRSPAYDAIEIRKMLSLLALAHPEVQLTLVHNQKKELQVKESEIGPRISELLGADYYASLLPVEAQKGELKLYGYIGMPGFSRHNRTGQYVFVNHRAVISPLVSFTVRESYGTSLATSRHPVFVLYLDLPGSLVDPNVHPQKKEVRLRQEQDLRNLIHEAVGKAMQSGGSIVQETRDPYFEYYGSPRAAMIPPPVNAPYTFEPLPIVKEPPVEPKHEPMLIEKEPAPVCKIPKILAAIRGYLVLEEEGGGLLLLDQRAVHFRLLYEKMQNRERKQQVQSLLIPLTLELSAVDAELLRAILPELQKVGLQMEEFGQSGFIIHGYPAEFTGVNIEKWLKETLASLHGEEAKAASGSEREKKTAWAASRAAIGKEQMLSHAEAESLVRQWCERERPGFCPFGKKTAVAFPREKLEKLFV